MIASVSMTRLMQVALCLVLLVATQANSHELQNVSPFRGLKSTGPPCARCPPGGNTRICRFSTSCSECRCCCGGTGHSFKCFSNRTGCHCYSSFGGGGGDLRAEAAGVSRCCSGPA